MKKFFQRIEKATPYALFAYVSAILVLALAAPYLLKENFSAGAIANATIVGSFAWSLLLFSAIGTFDGDDEIMEYHKRIEREQEEVRKLARKLEQERMRNYRKR